MSTQTAHILQEAYILATGKAATAATLAQWEAMVAADRGYGRIGALLEAEVGRLASQQGALKTVQQLALNGLGVSLSNADAQAVMQSLQAQGVNSWAKLLELVVTSSGGAYTALDNRADAANAFNDTLAAQGKAAYFSGAGIDAAVRTLLQNVGSSSASLATATTGLNLLASKLSAGGIQASVVDGYLKGATVYADSNGNRQLDAGEWSTTTDSAGNFTLPGHVTGTLVATGGIDLLTKKAFKGMLTSLTGGTLVNPITTMVQSLVDKGKAATVEQAVTKLRTALKLPGGVDLLTYDPLAVLGNSQASAAEKQVALDYQKVALKLVNIINVSAAALDAAKAKVTGSARPQADGAGSPSASLDEVIDSVAGALGDAADHGGTADLSDAGFIRGVLADAAGDTGTQLDADDLGDIAGVIDSANDAADSSSDITSLGRNASAATDATESMESGNFDTAADSYSGSGFTTSAQGQEVGDVADGVGAGDTSPQPTTPDDPGTPDKQAPTLAITSSATRLAAGGTATITFTFSEDPGASFTATDVSVTGGTLGALSGTGATRTATFTAAAGTTLSTGADITVQPGSFYDSNGNTGDAKAGASTVSIDTVFNPVLFVGNSATFARVDPVMGYNTYNASTNPGGVHDLTSPANGGTFANLTGSNLYEPHEWGGVAGLFDKFADQLGLGYDVSLSTRNAATLKGHYLNSSPAGWDMRGNIASQKWDMVVLQDQTDEPLPGGSGSITFAAGSATATLVITPTADAAKEYDESLALTIASGTGYRVGTSSAVTTTILNDDPTAPTTNPALPTVTLATTGSVLEDGHANLTFTFTRTGSTAADLTVSFTPTRDGTQPSVASPLATTGDVELYSSSTNKSVAVGTSGSSARFSSGNGFVLDTDTGPNTTTGSISFTGGGTGTIVIKAGQTSASVTYDPRTDAVVEVDESIRFTLNSSGSYNVGTQGAVTGTIVNDDFAAGTDTSLPNITLGLGSAAGVYESSGQSLVYTFTRSGDTSSALKVNFGAGGTATYFSSDASKSDFSFTTSGATGATLTTTSGANADIAEFTKYTNLIEDFIHSGAADTTTTPGTAIPANLNASAETDVYLYATWARPDMVAGAFDMITSKTVEANGANSGGTISRSDTQATAYYLRLEDMSTDLTNAYNNLAAANSDFKGVAAVSTAFMAAVTAGLAIRDTYNETATGTTSGGGKVNLWFDDNLHASKYGSYLAGLVLFETLTGLDARALGAGDQVASDLGIDNATAVALQGVASATAGFNQSYHYSGANKVTDLAGTNTSASLAAAGGFSFADATYSAHTVTVQGQSGNLGTLTASVRSDGHMGQVNWLYLVDNSVVDPLLTAGQSRQDRFTVLVDDGHGHVSTEIVGVSLYGG